MKNYKSQQKAINKYYNERVKYIKEAESFITWKGVRVTEPTLKDRELEIKDINKRRQKMLDRLEAVSQAEPLKYIEARVEWHKSRTWGHNPRAEGWTSGGHYDTGTASGCGYCKESTAIEQALKQSLSLQRFIIENLSKLKDEYGIETRFGIAHLSIGGKGVSTLLNIFRKVKGWTINEMHGRTFDGYRIEKNK